MRTAILLLTSLVVACGPSYTQTVKSPDEMLAEQEALGAEQVKKSDDQASYSDVSGDTTTESEKAAKFDKKHTEMEVSRAKRSAVTCPGVSEQGPYGEAEVSLTFINDGHVAQDKTTISAPFAGTPIGDCVLRAMNAIITKNFEGAPVTISLKIPLEEPPRTEKAKKK